MSTTTTPAPADAPATSPDAAATPTASGMRHWGWGVDGHDGPLPGRGLALLEERVGPLAEPVEPVRDPTAVCLPDPAPLPAGAARALSAAVGAEHLATDHGSRLAHAAGRSYPDLLRLRAGRLEHAPDAVVSPASHDEVAAVLAACAEHGVAVVPFGGGTSVVGGVDALRGPHAAAIALDLRRLDRAVAIDARSGLATLGAGMLGPAAERALGEHGLTLGHHPQSFEFSTIGGWVATRSAGQASTGNGRIDANVRGVRLAAPAGDMTTLPVPASAAGPDLRALIVGSEGTLGVITEATLRVRPVAPARHHEGWILDGFAEATEAFRELVQREAGVTVARLSDEEETASSLAMGGGAGRALGGYARARGIRRPCLAILGFEGTRDLVAARRRAARRILQAHGAVSLGAKPGTAWAAGRYHGPYLRDTLMGRGLLVDTLETAATWTDLLETYRAVGSALRQALGDAFVGCHVSHLYATGASLYFTYVAPVTAGEELALWRTAKTAASQAISDARATITHHHAVGTDHAPWLAGEVGPLGVDVLRAAKAVLDPTGIMNPGKLLPMG